MKPAGLAGGILMTLVSPVHRLPSGPVVIAWAVAISAIGVLVTTVGVAGWKEATPPAYVTQSWLSGPAVIPTGLVRPGASNSCTVPSGEMRA